MEVSGYGAVGRGSLYLHMNGGGGWKCGDKLEGLLYCKRQGGMSGCSGMEL